MKHWIIKATFSAPPAEEAMDRLVLGFSDEADSLELEAMGTASSIDMEFTLHRDDGTSDYTIQNKIAALVVWLQLHPEIVSVSSEYR